MHQAITATQAATPVGAYPHAIKAGNFLYLSGIGPRSAADNTIPGLVLDAKGNYTSFDFAAQVHSVMANIKAVLTASQATWEQLIDVTVYLTDMKRDFTTFNTIYATYFTTHQPCRTTVAVTALPTPIAIELKCVAYIP